MGSADHKKAKRRKTKKATKLPTSSSSSVLQPSPAVSIPDLPLPPNAQPAVTQQQREIEEIQKLMDAEDDHEPPAAPFSKGPNPYLGGDRCLLCHCERPEEAKIADEKEEDENGAVSSVTSLNTLPLWVCHECRKTVEEGEKKSTSMTPSILDPLQDADIRIDPASLSLITELTPTSETSIPNGTMCTCEACIERRQIEVESEKESQELQKSWMELRHVVRCMYREAGTELAQGAEGETRGLPDHERMKDLVHRLVVRDPHQLFQRLESQAQEYVIEVKVRLLKQMSSGLKTPQQARQFVSLLLEEYRNLCAAAKSLAYYLTDLENEHLKRFNLTWELHNKHLFHSTIYSDPMLLNKLPLLMAHLRFNSKEGDEDPYTSVLHGYCKFDDEMSVISVVWRDCYQLIDNYNDEQTAMKAKQKMLREDWEFFKAQRKLLEQQVMKNKTSSNTSTHSLETQFTETMRHILQGTKPSAEECLCPSCNRKRCPCDECSISHMITCGIINTEVSDAMAGHHNPLLFTQDPSAYIIDVTPPSMSSTSSSSGSDSPVNVGPEKLALPFDEMADEIPEEIEVQYGDSDDEDSAMDDGRKEERGAGDGADATDDTNQIMQANNGDDSDYDDDDDDDDDDEDDDEDDDDDDDESDDDDDDDDDEDDDEDEDDEDVDSQDVTIAAVTTTTLQFAGFGAQVPVIGTKADSCDCNQCTLQAKLEQQAKSLEESQNQCQCHACLQQSGKTMATALPQHLPVVPRPAALHLYPHIHGANTLHPGLHAHTNQLRPAMLQPHLYQLHNPILTTKSSSQSVASSQSATAQDKPHSTNAAISLELDSRDTLSEHFYNAFPEWDSTTYDHTKLMLSQHKLDGSLSSELFSGATPPLLTGAQFGADLGIPLDNNSLANIVKTSTILQQFPSTSKPQTTTTVTTATGLVTSLGMSGAEPSHGCVSSASSDSYLKSLKPISHSLFTQALNAQVQAQASQANAASLSGAAASSSGHHQAVSQEAVHAKPALLGPSSTFGSLATTMVSSVGLGAVSSVPSSTSAMALGAAQTDFCQKHNSFLHGQPFAAAAALGSQSLGVGHTPQPLLNPHVPPMKLNTEMRCSAAKEEALKALGPNLSMFNLPRTCNLSANMPLTAASNTLVQLAAASSNKSMPAMTVPTALPLSPGVGAAAASVPTTTRPFATKAGMDASAAASVLTQAQLAAATNNNLNNVSVGTSTLCQDGECEGHVAEDNYDSIDDSCSEQSSSTSTSNQKDGKYCDCCYCEFFGHTTSQTLPTSRNFAEMRDKLRLKLKKKQDEQKTGDVPEKPEIEEAPVGTPDPLEQKGLEELLRYINGNNEANEKAKAELKQSAKAAKRARQKQRKAEEKQKKEAEEKTRQENEAKAHRSHSVGSKPSRSSSSVVSNKSSSNTSQSSNEQCTTQQQKKKKSKHKDDMDIKSEKTSTEALRAHCKATTSASNSSVPAHMTRVTCSSQHQTVCTHKSSQKAGTTVTTATKAHNPTHHNPANSHNTNSSHAKPQTNSSASSVNCKHAAATKNEPQKSQKNPSVKASAEKIQVKSAPEPASGHHNSVLKPTGTDKKHVQDRGDKTSGHQDHRSKQPTQSHDHHGKPPGVPVGPAGDTNRNDKKKRTKQNGPVVSSAPSIQPHAQTTASVGNSKHHQTSTDKPSQQQLHSLLDHMKKPPNKNNPQDTVNAKNNQRNIQHQQPQAKGHGSQPQPASNSKAGNPSNLRTGPKKDDGPLTNHKVIVSQSQAHPGNNNNHVTAGGKGQGQSHTQHQHHHGNPQQQQQQQTQQQQQQQQASKRKIKKVNGNPNFSQPQQSHAQHSPIATGQNDLSHHQTHGKGGSQPSTPVKQLQNQHQHQSNNTPPKDHQVSLLAKSKQTKGQPHEAPVPEKMMNGGLTTIKVNDKKMPSRGSPPGTDRPKAEERPTKATEQSSGGKAKKNKRKNKPPEDLDEIFMPKEDENGDLDEYEREIEEFKRFCMDSTPVQKREKLQVNVNLKDIFSKKKSGLGCA